MTQTTSQGNMKLRILFVAMLPFLFFGIFYLYTKRARTDAGTMKYPEKMYPIGVDTVYEGNFKKLDSVYHTIPEFDVLNQYGQEITKANFQDKIIVVDFFFTSCPSICPKMTDQLMRVQENYIRDDQIVLLSFTIDPTRDTLAQLKEYADAHNAIPGKWHFLYGEKEDVYPLANYGFKLSAQDEGGEASHDDFVHSDRFVLIDPNWNIRGYYNGTSTESVNILMGDIVLLLEEFKR